LDSRDFLAHWVPPNFGVLSLITLSTPHMGSAGADYLLDAQNATVMASDNATRTAMSLLFKPDIGTVNLRVSFVENFNRVNGPLLPKQFTVDGRTREIHYWTIGADANLDGSVSFPFANPTIQYNETQGIAGQDMFPASSYSFLPGVGYSVETAFAYAMEQVYRLLFNVASTQLKQNLFGALYVAETPASYQYNDFAVTETSAHGPDSLGFGYLADVKDNHATIANPAVGAQVIEHIKVDE
jgi:hypothetical protein